MPSLSGAGSGALKGGLKGAALGSVVPGVGTVSGGLGGAALGGLWGLFGGGGGDDEKELTDLEKNALGTEGLAGHAAKMGSTSDALQQQGADTLGPALQYLQSILGTNPSAILSATAPERGRVIDQYDTARQAIATFAPRGGGQQAAFAGTYSDQANDLTVIFSTARREGFSQAMAVGSNQIGLGLSAAQLEAADLNTILNTILTREGFDMTKRGQNMEALAAIGEALGTIIAEKTGGG
jgi:hypothetical protein